MANLTEGKEKRVLGLNGNMWMYALGLMGINLGIGLINSYQVEFFNKILNANLVYIAIIILAAKFISIFADIVIGNLIDKAHFKSGKMRPWIGMSAFPLFVLTLFSFIGFKFPDTSAGIAGKYIYIVLILILWNISMSLADIPSSGMLSFVSKNPEDVNNAAGMGNTLKSIAIASPGVFITVVCMITGSEGVGEKEYLITAGVMAGLGLILQILMYFKCKEKATANTSQGMSFKEMLGELKNNKMILIVLGQYLVGFGRTIGLAIAVQASCILFRDGIDFSWLGMGILYGDQASWAIGLTSAVTSMVVILLNPVINKKLGEKKFYISFGIAGFIVCLVSYLLYVYVGGVFRTLWAIWIYQALLGFTYGPNNYLPMVMTADIVDYQEWKTGKRTEGTQFAILSMSFKLNNALSVALGVLLIGVIGYSSDTYFANVAAGTINSYITDDMQNKTWAIYFLLPGISMLASSLLMFFYKIDEKTKKQMREELAIRHGEVTSETNAEDSTEEITEETVEDAETKE